MKSNVPLQDSIQFVNYAQKVWYAANVLRSALVSSPAIQLRAAKAAVAAKPAIVAQTAKPARAASTAVAAAGNTIGYAFGELYLNSPAYPIGTAIPAIPAKPASAAVAAVAAVPAVAAVTAVASPAVVALQGYEDAISIVKTASALTITADLPVYRGPVIVGSDKLAIGEITPSTLQANAWLDDVAFPLGSCVSAITGEDLATETLEQFLYRNALLCNHTIADVVKTINGVATNCKRLVVTLVPYNTFDLSSASLQLTKVS